MKPLNKIGAAPLTNKDIEFLKFLDRGSYQGTSTLQLPERDKLRKIIDVFDILFYLIDACFRHFKIRRANAGRIAIKNLTNALTGKFPDVSIDFSKVRVLEGPLAPPCGAMHHTAGSSILNFSWAACTQCNSNCSDELMAIIYCPERRQFWCEQNLGIRRSDKFCTIEAPDEFEGTEVHVWLAYRSSDQRINSCSSYMGKALITKGDDHESV